MTTTAAAAAAAAVAETATAAAAVAPSVFPETTAGLPPPVLGAPGRGWLVAAPAARRRTRYARCAGG